MKENLSAIVAIAVTSVAFMLFFVVPYAKLANALFPAEEDRQTLHKVLSERLAGFIILGILPVISYIILTGDQEFTGLTPLNFLWTCVLLACMLIVLPVSYKNAHTAENLKVYPQIRVAEWGAGLTFINAASWALYLLGYEYLLRGFLLFKTVPSLGLWGAIAINTVIYALAHLPKGSKETIASVPFGIILCLISWYSGSFWIAFCLHVCLAVSNDIFSVRAQPQMQFTNLLRVLNVKS